MRPGAVARRAGARLVLTLGNHGLWLAINLFMAVRAITLAAVYPRLLRAF